MRRIILSFIVVMLFAVGASAQYTYIPTFNDVTATTVPSPWLNTQTGSSATTGNGWTELIAPSQATNSWSATQAIPFPFDFFGTPVTHFKVSGNGVMTFDTMATALPTDNTNLPAPASANIPDMSILGFWDAFTGGAPTGSNDRILMKEWGTAPNRELWISFFSYEYGVNASGTSYASSFVYYSYAIQEGTNKILVIDYDFAGSGASLTGTVGVQKDASVAVQYGDSTLTMATGTGYDYWEFTPLLLVNDNAGITSIDEPTLPLTPGLKDVKVTVKNHGSNALTSATLNWAVNGVVQTSVPWTGNLASQTSTATPVTLGQFNFSTGNSLIEAWTSLPNGVADAQPSNDTASTSACTALSGTFTVGGAGANYPDIASALSAVEMCGISGPITFNVAAGTYNGEVSVGTIPGVTAANNITVNGAGMASTILSYDKSGTNNAALLLDGASYMTFKNMTIENTATSTQTWGVRMAGNAHHITFDSCKISTYNTATSSSVATVVATNSATSAFSYANNANYITISNSELAGGYYGARFNGVAGSSGSGYNVGNQIINTRAVDHYGYAFYGIYQDSFTVKNCVAEPSRATFGYGVYCTQNRNPFIEGNWIKDCETYGIGIFSTNRSFNGATGVRGRVVNNMVTSKNFGEGLYFSSLENMDIFHNSIYSTDEQALYHSGTATGMDYRNNIFVSVNNKVIDFTSSFPGSATFDYNIIYRGSPGDIAEESTYSAPTLADWKIANPAQNQNSIEGAPNYVDAPNHDLHVGIGAGLISGDNTAGVLVDFDGDARPFAPTTIVDIGADEIFVQNLDAGVTSLDGPTLPITPGLNNILVSIKNNGATALTAVTINWAVDGVVQTPYSWTGNVTIGQEDNNINIGQYNIASGTYNLEIWTSAPNGGTDGDSSNDTLFTHVCTPLSGSYTVGPNPTDDYSSIQAAASSLDCGVSGPVTFNIASGTYNEYVTITLAPGASSTNTVTFSGSGKDSVLLTHAPTSDQNATILFDGGTYTTFENMTIENTGPGGSGSYSWGIRLTNGADYNKISNSRITVDTLTTSSSGASCIIASGSATSAFTQGNNANNTTILNCDIIGGYYGVNFYGQTGSSGANLNTGNKVENCNFDNQYGYGMYFYAQDKPTAKSNRIEEGFRATFGYGVYHSQGREPTIEANYINGAGTYGIYVTGVNNSTYPSTKAGKVANNMVRSYSFADCFYFSSVNNMNVYHNTGYAEGDQAFYCSNIDTFDIRNNIFVSETSEPFEYLSTPSGNDVIDYNLYWRTDGGNIAEMGSAFYADLNAWTTAVPTDNVKSVEGDPLFFDSPNGDLHLIGGLANDVGAGGTGVVRDIDGDLRPQAPSTVVDIGADEYTPLFDDLKILEVYMKTPACNTATDSVWAVVQSIGLNPVTSFNVNVDVSGATTASISTAAASNINIGGIDTVLVGTFNSAAGGIFDIEGYVTLTGDQDATNDTSAVLTVQRMSAPTGVVTDVACQGDSTGEIVIDVTNIGALATVVETQTLLGPSMSYTVNNFSYTTPPAMTGVELVIDAVGDNDFSSEFWNIIDENGVQIGTYGMHGLQCQVAPEMIISISDADYASYMADGVATFNAIPSAAVNFALCGGDFFEMTLRGNGTPTLTWSNGDSTTHITGLAAGSYTVTVTDLLGCTQSSTFMVNQAANPSPSITNSITSDVTCFGLNDGGASVTATGGTGMLNYAWSSGDSLSNAANLAPGTYSVIVSDVNGCSDSTSLTITQPDTLVAGNAGVTVAGCDSFLVSTSVTGGTGAYTFSWTGGSSDTTLLVTATGSYTATVSDANGCTDTLSATVTLPPALAAAATATAADTSGAGNGAATATGSGGTAPYTYAWSNGATTASVDSLIFGNYTVTITDANGCSETASVAINFPVNTNNLTVMGNISMFPNPTNGQVTLNVALKQTSDLTITIFNAIGQEVFTLHEGTTDNVQTQFDMSQMAGGVYMVRFAAGNDVVTKRLIVRK